MVQRRSTLSNPGSHQRHPPVQQVNAFSLPRSKVRITQRYGVGIHSVPFPRPPNGLRSGGLALFTSAIAKAHPPEVRISPEALQPFEFFLRSMAHCSSMHTILLDY